MERISDVLDASREQEGQNVVTAHRLSGLVRAASTEARTMIIYVRTDYRASGTPDRESPPL
jgi:hypothetical protein